MGKEKQTKGVHPLLCLAVIFSLSLAGSVILFGILKSTGVFKNKYGEFGGAAAGFFASLILLNKLYKGMEKRYNDVFALRKTIDELESETVRRRLPPFKAPDGMELYRDLQKGFLFCYPEGWLKIPMSMELQGIFREDPNRLRAGDAFPGTFNVLATNTGQKNFSVREICLVAERQGIPQKEMAKELGIQITDRTLELQVPLERLLSILEPDGKDKREKIYNLNYQFMNAVLGSEIKRTTEYVDNIPSLLLEYEIDRPEDEPIVCIQVFTYIEGTEMIYIFTFQDNLADREYIESVRKQVIQNTRLWNPNDPRRLQD
jgi:hypothetical protein